MKYIRLLMSVAAVIVASEQQKPSHPPPSRSGANDGDGLALAIIDGSLLKWIDIAQREFKARKIDEDEKVIEVRDTGTSIVITAITSHPPDKPRIKGGTGKTPDIVVEIRKADRAITRWSYMR